MKNIMTDRQAQQRDELIAKRDAPIELPEGAKTLIEESIDESDVSVQVIPGAQRDDRGY